MSTDDALKKLNEIKFKRGEIITNFAHIEMLMSRIIATTYSREKAQELVDDILEDEYFNFGLRRKIFEKVIKKYYAKNKINFDKLQRLGQVRNIIAHAIIRCEAPRVVPPQMRKMSREPFYPHGGKEYDCIKLHAEYFLLKEDIHSTLKKMTGAKEIPSLVYPDDKKDTL